MLYDSTNFAVKSQRNHKTSQFLVQRYDVFVELLLSIQMKKCSFCSFFTQIEHYIKYFYYLCGE